VAGLYWLALLYWRFLLAGLLVWAWAILVGSSGGWESASWHMRGGCHGLANKAFDWGGMRRLTRQPAPVGHDVVIVLPLLADRPAGAGHSPSELLARSLGTWRAPNARWRPLAP